MPVSFLNLRRSIDLFGKRTFLKTTGIATESHGPSLFLHCPLFREQVDHFIVSCRIEFTTVGPFQPGNVTSKFHDRTLHPQTESKKRNPLFPGVANRRHFAFDPSGAEPARNQNSVGLAQKLLGTAPFKFLRFDQSNIDAGIIGEPAVYECLRQTFVGLLERHVFSDHPNGHFMRRAFEFLDHGVPITEVGRTGFQPQEAHDQLIEPFFSQHDGHFVHGIDVFCRDHRVFVHVAKQCDFVFQRRRQETVGPAQQDMGLDADFAKFVDGMLGGFGFQLSRGFNKRHQGEMNIQDVFAAHVERHLSDGFEKRQTFDITDCPPYFHDHHVRAVCHA